MYACVCVWYVRMCGATRDAARRSPLAARKNTQGHWTYVRNGADVLVLRGLEYAHVLVELLLAAELGEALLVGESELAVRADLLGRVVGNHVDVVVQGGAVRAEVLFAVAGRAAAAPLGGGEPLPPDPVINHGVQRRDDVLQVRGGHRDAQARPALRALGVLAHEELYQALQAGHVSAHADDPAVTEEPQADGALEVLRLVEAHGEDVASGLGLAAGLGAAARGGRAALDGTGLRHRGGVWCKTTERLVLLQHGSMAACARKLFLEVGRVTYVTPAGRTHGLRTYSGDRQCTREQSPGGLAERLSDAPREQLPGWWQDLAERLSDAPASNRQAGGGPG